LHPDGSLKLLLKKFEIFFGDNPHTKTHKALISHRFHTLSNLTPRNNALYQDFRDGLHQGHLPLRSQGLSPPEEGVLSVHDQVHRRTPFPQEDRSIPRDQVP